MTAIIEYDIEDLRLMRESPRQESVNASVESQHVSSIRTIRPSPPWFYRQRKKPSRTRTLHLGEGVTALKGVGGSEMFSPETFKSSSTDAAVQSTAPEQTTAVTISFSNSSSTFTLFKLSHLYVIENVNSIEKFLEHNPGVLSLLGQAVSKIRGLFETEVLSLRIDKDPDDAGLGRLYLSINTSRDFEEATAKLDELDEKWWLETQMKTEANVTITLGFTCSTGPTS